jgi:predicted small metal-binding protein
MTKHIACTEIIAGCPFEASAASEEDLLRRVADHARESHGVAQVTPELAEKVKAAIRER